MARYLNELDAVTSLQDTDTVYIEQGGNDKKTNVKNLTEHLFPVGIVTPHLESTAPDGWLLCDGSAVDRTTYADLFALIGETYGIGDGSTTFNLPDYRGQFLRGAGTHSSQTMANGTAYNGGSLGNYEEDGFQGHTHLQSSYNYDNKNKSSGTDGNIANNPRKYSYTSTIGAYGDYGTPRVGYETKPTSYSVNYIIKY